jgi:hypothetical protein
MQLSVKTPPELTLPVLEKCAALDYSSPSLFVADCAFQCLNWMETPHRPFHPLSLVEKYYHATGQEDEIHARPRKKQDALMQRLATEDRVKRVKEAARRVAEFKAQLKRRVPSKHLHLKISPGSTDLTGRIKEKTSWFRLTPNALVVACLRDCLEAMDDPRKAIAPPPIVVDFWTLSHAKLRPKAANAVESMVLESYEKMLRERSGPILDTIVRLALSKKWNATLEQILLEAGVIPKSHDSKS